VFASATADPTGRRSVRSPADQQEANQRTSAQMQQQISELTSLVTQLHMRAEKEDAKVQGDERAGSAARREQAAREELAQLKQQFKAKQDKQSAAAERTGNDDAIGV
jgi:hypothetical protein